MGVIPVHLAARAGVEIGKLQERRSEDAILRGRPRVGTFRDGVKRKERRDQASAGQRYNLEVDVGADILDENANPRCT